MIFFGYGIEKDTRDRKFMPTSGSFSFKHFLSTLRSTHQYLIDLV